MQEKMEDYKKQLDGLSRKVDQLMAEKASLETRSECQLFPVMGLIVMQPQRVSSEGVRGELYRNDFLTRLPSLLGRARYLG